MSLYRQAGGISPRTLAAALVVAVLLGGLTGFLVGRGSVEEPSAAELIADAREALGPVELGLEQIPIEYEGALRGNRVFARTEYEAAQATAARTRDALAETAEDMQAIDPTGYDEVVRSIAQLSAAIDAVATPRRIDALARAAQARVDALAGA